MIKSAGVILTGLAGITAIVLFIGIQESYESCIPRKANESEEDRRFPVELKNVVLQDEDVLSRKEKIKSDSIRITISGLIKSRNDLNGIKGAEVKIALLTAGKSKITAAATSEAGGRFSTGIALKSGQKCKAALITTKADGYSCQEDHFEIRSAAGSFDCGTLFLDEERNNKITVIDQEGQPIAGAGLMVYAFFFNHNDTRLLFNKKSNKEGNVILKDKLFKDSRNGLSYLIYVSAKNKSNTFKIIKNDNLPETIILEETYCLSSKVVDSKTKSGIKNARVETFMRRVPMHACGEVFKNNTALTDDYGAFVLDRIKYLGKNHVDIKITAEGFMPFVRTYREKLPDLIELKPAEKMIVFRLIDGKTNLGISDAKVKYGISGNKSTNDQGICKIPVDGSGRISVLVQTKRHGFYEESCIEIAEDQFDLSIILEPLETTNLLVNVHDEFGRPVPSANVRLDYGYGTNRFTKKDGVASFEQIEFCEEKIAVISVTHHNYTKEVKTNFEFFRNHDNAVDVVMKGGRSFRKVKIVDQSGKPLEGIGVTAELTASNGKRNKISGKSNHIGFCDFVFPDFIEGIVYVTRRPDLSLYIDQKSIDIFLVEQIVFSEEIWQSSAIQGVVRDETGNELSGILIKVVEKGQCGSYAKQGYSANDGTFNIPVLANRSYDLDATPVKKRGYWYYFEKKDDVLPGTNICILMKKEKGVLVDIRELRKKQVKIKESNVELEVEDGSRVQLSKKYIYHNHILLMGVPSENSRVVIRAEGDQSYRSDLINPDQDDVCIMKCNISSWE